MSKIALVVEFNVKAGQRDAFLKIMRNHASGTKQDEDGCIQFDVLIPEDDDNKVLLVEMYHDEAALDIHVRSPRLQATRSAYAEMIENRKITKTRVDGS